VVVSDPLIPFSQMPSPANQKKLGQIIMKYLVIQFLSERIFTMLFVLVQMFLWIKVFELEIHNYWWLGFWYAAFDITGIFRQWWLFRIEQAHQHESQQYLPSTGIEDFRSDR
jgi:hypothetical protein